MPRGSSKKSKLNSMRWRNSLAEDDGFFVLAGSSEGGFMDLEEIDAAEYADFAGAAVPAEEVDVKGEMTRVESASVDAVANAKEKKRKRSGGKSRSKKAKEMKMTTSDEEDEGEDKGNIINGDVEGSEITTDNVTSTDNSDQLLLGEDEVDEWKQLRLHPLLIKSMRRLGFKAPTPIQKACFPAAACKGKDVIGAAETGSGKTLAFGLPILQRLLEERDKSGRLLQEGKKPIDDDICGSPLRALIVAPTRELAKQVCDHLKDVAKFLDIHVVAVVGGMSMERQKRLLKRRPEIIVGTPGRLWELISEGEKHLFELHSLSFFVLDEADRMIEKGHYRELQSIIDMLPIMNNSTDQTVQASLNCETVPSVLRKKRQTFLFSATISLSNNFRKKLKHKLSSGRSDAMDSVSSIEALSEQAGLKPDVEIVDLTNASILPHKLEESFIECSEEEKDACLYYILRVHGNGRTIVFCTSIAALRHISSMLRILGVSAWAHHAQMQQRARLKAMDHFRQNDSGVLVATDGFARGLDVKDVRTVIHYQLPHSAEVYVHRCGRTARALADGCSIALISPADKAKFNSLCKSLSKENLRQFPIDYTYMPEVTKRLALAREIDMIMLKSSQESRRKSWLGKNAESLGLALEDNESEEEQTKKIDQKKAVSGRLLKLQKDLKECLANPLEPKNLSHRYFAGGAISLLLQRQLEELSKQKSGVKTSLNKDKRQGLFVIGQECVEPLRALQNSGQEVCVNVDKKRKLQVERKKRMQSLALAAKQRKRDEKKRLREQKRNAAAGEN